MARGIQRYRNKKLHKRFYAELAPLIKPWQWSETGSPATIGMAKKDLYEFVRRAKELLPIAKVYDFEPLAASEGGDTYMMQLLSVMRQLDEKRWDNACHELYNVVHFYCVQDRRILYTIICLLEAYI